LHRRTDRPQATASRASGHLAWAYTGPPESEGRAASFLVQGHLRGQRQIFIADDPAPRRWPRRLIERGDLLLLSTAEVYGGSRTVDPASQRAAFEACLAEATALGYTGLRVAADNTALVSGPVRLEAWIRWEDEAERLMQEHPITGLCAFDRTRTDPTAIHTLMGLHPAVLQSRPPLEHRHQHTGRPHPSR
jgi:hypothetical protein